MIHKADKEAIEEYFASGNLSQSGIKIINTRGMEAFLDNETEILQEDSSNLQYEEKTHFIIGSAVDHIISFGMDSFEDNYIKMDYSKDKPSDTVMSIIKSSFDSLLGTIDEDISVYGELLQSACNTHKYYTKRAKENWQEDTRVINIINDPVCVSYWQSLCKSKGKQVLSGKEYDIVIATATTFTDDKYIAPIFIDSPNVDIFFQLPLYFSIEEISCKALLDIVRIDHVEGSIKIYDMKTTSEYATNFHIPCRIMRYDLQGAFYKMAVDTCRETIGNKIGKNITNYTIHNMFFIVGSKLKSNTPVLYQMTDGLNALGTIGDGRFAKGFWQGIQEYKKWRENEFSLSTILDNVPDRVVMIDADYNTNI